MSMNSVLESLSETNDEQIKRLAAFFADEVYRSYQIQYIVHQLCYNKIHQGVQCTFLSDLVGSE